MLQVLDQTFDVVATRFSYRLAVGEEGWKASLTLGIDARSAVDDDPTLTLEDYALRLSLPAPDALAGRVFDLATPGQDVEDDEPPFLLSFHEHEPVTDVRLAFGDWDGGQLRVTLTGKVDFEDEEGQVRQAAPLRFDAQVPFDGVVVDEGWTHKAEERLAQFFDRARFEDPFKRPDGAHVFRRKLAP